MIELSENISEYLENTFGREFLENYKIFVDSKYPFNIRVSETVKNIEILLSSLNEQGINLTKSENIPNAYFVKSGEDKIGKTLEHILGEYYIQSLSSMIPPLVLNPNKNDLVMDLCAAPGSKSTQLSQLMNNQGALFSNEPNLNRVKALVYNLDKMNSVNTSVIKYKGELLSKQFPNYFDKILVDAPCSALGVVQKKQEVSNWWSSKSVQRISDIQLKLLISAIKMAKVGGEIVYSTCTLTVEENEFIINKVLNKYPVELVPFNLELKHINGFTKISNYEFDNSLELTKRIIPWEIQSEGFFVAKLRKIELTESTKLNNKFSTSDKILVNSKDKKIAKYIKMISKHFGIPISIFNQYKYIINGKDINFVSHNFNDNELDFFLRIGSKFGLIDKNDNCKLNSNAAQILAQHINKSIFVIENEEELKKYLAGGIIIRKNDILGQKVVKYKKLCLGTGIAQENQLKSQFPRSKRAANININ